MRENTYFVGIDVGKSFHHVVVLDGDGGVAVSRRVSQDESEIRITCSYH